MAQPSGRGLRHSRTRQAGYRPLLLGVLAGSVAEEASATSAAGYRVARRTGILHSNPVRPTGVPFYPPQDLLDCEGSNFSAVWRDFRRQATASAKKNFPRDQALYERAAVLVSGLQEHLLPASLKLPQVLVRQIPVTRMNGFCLYGFVTALFVLFRHDLNQERLLAIEQSMGWVEWALDFFESSAWPTLWRYASLHLEELRRRGDLSWSERLQHWGDDEDLLPRPKASDVQVALKEWLEAVGPTAIRSGPAMDWDGEDDRLALARVLKDRAGESGSGALRMLVLGHHLGSSMEPFSMLREALRVGTGLEVKASLYGQRHPKPGLACKEFGYCEENKDLEDWFRRYESRWLGEYDWMPDGWDEALAKLSLIVGSSGFLSMAEVVVCGGPAWFCVMLRTLWAVPMLLYFAWPITPLVPAGFKTHIFAHVRALAQTSNPPTVFVVANWILAAQFALQVRMQVPVQRPHGIYVNQTYSPVPMPDGTPRVMVTRIGQWARLSGVALLELTWAYLEQGRRSRKPFPFELVFLSIRVRGADTNSPLRYADFAAFHACVFWPWDVMMLLFNELYTITTPLLLPARRWMVQLITHSLSHTEVNWWHLRESVKGGLPDPSQLAPPLPFAPWISTTDGLRPASYWYELTDFMQFPHLTYFESLPDMLGKLRTLDVPAIRRGMRSFNRDTFRGSIGFYRRAATELLR